ncbi:MAG: PQQ-binding-like beta-propeller repeat protein [Chloroflexota bacterium]|nr:PQQ-binding-like beta-propeller repeat protein [Chloroflexota bacterium]
MFITWSNCAVTPAPETLVRRATKTLILEATPTGSSSDVVSDARPNHEHCGGCNTNLRWLFKIWNDMFSSPAICNGVVYIGSDDGHVYALE